MKKLALIVLSGVVLSSFAVSSDAWASKYAYVDCYEADGTKHTIKANARAGTLKHKGKTRNVVRDSATVDGHKSGKTRNRAKTHTYTDSNDARASEQSRATKRAKEEAAQKEKSKADGGEDWDCGKVRTTKNPTSAQSVGR
jgi:ribosomal protein S24E